MNKYILGAVLSLGILVSPAYAQAALTNDQVQAILSLLTSFGADSAVIANVNSALTGTATSGTTSGGTSSTSSSTAGFCHNFTTDLTIGSTDRTLGEITDLNQALALSGIDTSGNTGTFDENTAADVVRFQAKYGIRQTGYVGPLTRAQLNSLYACSATQTPASTATIDDNSGQSIDSATSAKSVTIFGTATGVSAIGIVISAQIGDKVYANPSVPVINGQYRKVIPHTELNLIPGNYTVYIYKENTYENNALLTQGVISITSSASTATNLSNKQISELVLQMVLGKATQNMAYDINRDGQLTLADALAYLKLSQPSATIVLSNTEISELVTQMYLGKAPKDLTYDINRDGQITLADSLAYLKLPSISSATIDSAGNIVITGDRLGTAPYTVSVGDRGVRYTSPSSGTITVPMGYFGVSANTAYDVKVSNSAGTSNVKSVSITTVTPLTNQQTSDLVLKMSLGNVLKNGAGFKDLKYDISGPSGIPDGQIAAPDGQITLADSLAYLKRATAESLPAALDLKINNSDGPVTLSGAQSVALSWSATGVTNCHIYVARTNLIEGTVNLTGTQSVTVDPATSPYVVLSCNKLSGAETSDYVYVNAAATTPAPATGSLSFSKTSFSATYVQGTALPSTLTGSPNLYTNTSYYQTTTYTNTSGVTVNYTISVQNKPAWLNTSYATEQLSVAAGQTANLAAYLDPATVATTPGTYTTNITISGNFTGSPVTIPVTLTVAPSTTSTSANTTAQTTTTATQTSTTPSATINSASLRATANTSTTVSGTTNVSTVYITYTNSTGGRVTSVAIPVTNGTWSINYPTGFSSGSYQIAVKANSATGTVLTSGYLVVTPPTTTTTTTTTTTSSSASANTTSSATTATVSAACPTGATCPKFWTKAGSEAALCQYFTGTTQFSVVETKTIDAACYLTDTRCVSPTFYWMLGTWAVPENRTSYLPASHQIEKVMCLASCTEAAGCVQRVASASAGANQLASALGAAEAASSASAPSVLAYTWNNDLQVGSPLFADVTALQMALVRESVYTGDVTGGFYSQTYAAVQAFQAKYGIDPTGYVGPATRAQLNALY